MIKIFLVMFSSFFALTFFMIDWGINLVSISKGLLQLLNKDQMQAFGYEPTTQLLQNF